MLEMADMLDPALQASGCDPAAFLHNPRPLSNDGASNISGELAEWLEEKKMDRFRGTPYHHQTKGKTERLHQNLKNRILLEG
ncbi:hypothetical protein NBRC116596_30490 [Litorivita sp. NS0012-18]